MPGSHGCFSLKGYSCNQVSDFLSDFLLTPLSPTASQGSPSFCVGSLEDDSPFLSFAQVNPLLEKAAHGSSAAVWEPSAAVRVAACWRGSQSQCITHITTTCTVLRDWLRTELTEVVENSSSFDYLRSLKSYKMTIVKDKER